MHIYSVTLNIDKAIESEWLEWMQDCHIPDVMATGKFVEHKFMKLKDPIPEDGVTYSIQYHVANKGILQLYLEEDAPLLQEQHNNRYKGKFVAFRTILELV